MSIRRRAHRVRRVRLTPACRKRHNAIHGRSRDPPARRVPEDGGYVATSPDVPGLVAEGRSITEATEIAQRLARSIVESCLEHGDPVPPALSGMAGGQGPGDLLVPVGIR